MMLMASPMPKLIAPDPHCGWCVAQMRELTLTGQSLVSPGHCTGVPQQSIAGALHETQYHVHCYKRIGDADYAAVADVALPLLSTPTVVMYDRDLSGNALSLPTELAVADRRMRWADAVSESMKFARVGWRVIRVREPGLAPTSPLDIVLPRPITADRDNDAMLTLASQHVRGIVEANVAAA
jgi:hypothetical protein